MADVSWRSLLAPLLDVGAAATVVLVLQLAPVPLAGPVLQCLAKAWRGQELPGQSADNIVWKCAQYLPGITRGQRSVAPLPGSLTSVQKHCQQLPAVRIASAGSTCLCCGAETRGKKPLSGASICNNCTTLATNIQGLFSCGRAAVGRLDRATMSCVPPVRAGALVIQAAQAAFGHMTELQCHECEADGFFIMPRYRSFYAVEVALLNHITDCLRFYAVDP